MPVNLTCLRCGKGFSRPPTRAGNQHCSRECQYPPRIALTCDACGTAITKKPSQIHERNYCSLACKQTYRGPLKVKGCADEAVTSDDGLTLSIPLHAADGAIRAWAVVDIEDAAVATQYRWSLSAGYAVRGGRVDGLQRKIMLHREILGLPRISDGREGEHRDRNRLNNRRGNLRVATSAGNAQNKPARPGASSQYRGVRWYAPTNRWKATVTIDGKSKHLGYFKDELVAAEVAREARRIHMPFATD